MNYYLDITLCADAEISINFLRNKVYSKLHKALYDLKSNDIAVSFPHLTGKVSPTSKDNPSLGSTTQKLGKIIRLHSSQARLTELQQTHWLGALEGYCHLGDIAPIPKDIKGHKTYSRIQQTKSKSKLRRVIKRNKLTPKQIENYKKNLSKQRLSHPFIELTSTSNQQRYRIFIGVDELKPSDINGEFNHYGLSSQSTVPHF